MKQFTKWFLTKGIKQYILYIIGFIFIGILIIKGREYLDLPTIIGIICTYGAAVVAIGFHIRNSFRDRNK